MHASLRIHLRRVARNAFKISKTRGVHSTFCVLKEPTDDATGKSSGWPTAESVILQRVNSPMTIHPSLSHLKTVKEEEPTYKGESISSVSGIIDSVRATRAASQRSPWHKDDSGGPKSFALFDTHEVVCRLAGAGFTRSQANAIMLVVKNVTASSVARVRSLMLTRGDLENDAYLFRAALQELRMEMQMTRKNDQSVLQSQASAVHREIESLAQRTNDQIAGLRSDIEIEMNNHKHETSHEMKAMDVELHELATKYQMLMGEMKTDIEAIKLGSIRRGLITVVLTAMFLSAIFWGPHIAIRVKERNRKKSEEKNEEDAVLASDVMDLAARPSDSGSEQTLGGASAYRDYSHLNIKYHPTAASDPDDWYDSAILDRKQ